MACVATFLSGATGPIVLSMASGLQQMMAPPTMRARLAAIGTTITFGTQPFVNLAVGYTGEIFGAPTALLANGVFVTVLVLLLVTFRRSVRAEVIRPHTMVNPSQPGPVASAPDGGDRTPAPAHAPARAEGAPVSSAHA